MNNKKLILRFSIILIVLIIGFDLMQYKIKDGEQHVEKSIQKILNKSQEHNNTITLKKMVDIDNKRFVLFTIDSKIGYGELKKGINNRFKFLHAGYGTNVFQNRVFETNKSQYIVIMGKNYDMKINIIKATIEGESYQIDIPHQEYFIAYIEISKKVKEVFPSIKIIDYENNDITDEIYKKYLK